MKPDDKPPEWEQSLLVDAIRVWTGMGEETFPGRHDSRIIHRFGSEVGSRLLITLRHLETEFYKSDACYSAPDLATMAAMAGKDFRAAFPDMPNEIIEALGWCYTFDFK